MLGRFSKCKASWIKHTVSVCKASLAFCWRTLSNLSAFVWDLGKEYCSQALHQAALSCSPPYNQQDTWIIQDRGQDGRGEAPVRASGEGSTHCASPQWTFVPGTTGLCHLPRLQLQLCCHGPRPSCSLARQQGSPNSPALVSLALLWLPSHHPPPAFPWTAWWDGLCPAEVVQNVRGSSFQLGTIPFSWALSMNVLLSHVPRQQLLHSPALDGSTCSKPYHWGNLFLLWKVRMKLPKLSNWSSHEG